jgi:hypothetical protein
MNHRNIEIISVIVVILIILVPYGWIIYSHQSTGSFTDIASVEKIKDEMKKAGITVCNETEAKWSVPGALGGITYVISPDCNDLQQTPDVIVHTQKFESEQTMDAAIRSFNSQTHGKPNGVILTSGQYLILVQGHGHAKVASSLTNISTIS